VLVSEQRSETLAELVVELAKCFQSSSVTRQRVSFFFASAARRFFCGLREVEPELEDERAFVGEHRSKWLISSSAASRSPSRSGP
jgi:hypothetical protein